MCKFREVRGFSVRNLCVQLEGTTNLQIWKAVMALDLVKRRAIRAAERLLPGADLKAVLADPFMMEVCILLLVAPASCHMTYASRHILGKLIDIVSVN